jgi:hypothetical protein
MLRCNSSKNRSVGPRNVHYTGVSTMQRCPLWEILLYWVFDPILLVYPADIHLWTRVGFLTDCTVCRINFASNRTKLESQHRPSNEYQQGMLAGSRQNSSISHRTHLFCSMNSLESITIRWRI